ncbi:MAG: hypothetical protein R3178_11100, partial [Rhodothermales bacterium]|nr:hypothetical protein [Rhodothermales bacterium]
GLPVAVARPTAIYGPGDLRLLKLFQMVRRGRFLMVGDGRVFYHMVYVSDLVSGLRLLADHPAAVGEAFILGGSEVLSLNDLVDLIAELLGVRVGALEINDLAVHPDSNEIYISITRIESFASQPAIVKISTDHEISLLDTSSLAFQKQNLTEFPANDTEFRVRGTGAKPPLPRDTAKGAIAIRSLAIMDLEYYDGELFVAGVAYDNFRSALRRISYPFDGTQGVTAVEMYHITHDQYESRAPIRAMSVQQVDGKPQLVAAYTCSPIVLVPLDELVDGRKISASTIIDMGNGQPLDMIPFKMGDQPMLFVTNNSRSPQVIPVNGLSDAKAVTHDDFERGAKLDLHPLMPFGPAGKTVMFEGVPLHMALLDDDFFVSLTRDAYTGDLNLDINPTFFPNRVHNLVAEMDFPRI